jgi:hypothetical protein
MRGGAARRGKPVDSIPLAPTGRGAPRGGRSLRAHRRARKVACAGRPRSTHTGCGSRRRWAAGKRRNGTLQECPTSPLSCPVVTGVVARGRDQEALLFMNTNGAAPLQRTGAHICGVPSEIDASPDGMTWSEHRPRDAPSGSRRGTCSRSGGPGAACSWRSMRSDHRRSCPHERKRGGAAGQHG